MLGRFAQVSVLLLLIACAAGTRAQDKAEYDRRGAARYMSLFQSLDRNGDQQVSKLESAGTLDFGPRFDDMDINRDGIVTRAEMQRYVESEYSKGAIVPNPSKRK
jgi:hypothetical protein